MTRRRASRKLYAANVEAATLEKERHALEAQALGGEASDAERRARYFSIADVELRRKLIGIERRLHEVRQQQRNAVIEYWTTVNRETREDLDALRSDAPMAPWRQRIAWDIVTILWIIGGAGWIWFGIPGAAIGTAITILAAWSIVQSRKRSRPALIRQGQELLRSSERELQLAQRSAASATPAAAAFSAAEAETGLPG